jgi:hypothetical protein
MAWTPLPLDTNPDSVTLTLLDRLKTALPGYVPAEGDPLTVLAEELGREMAATNARTVHATDVAIADTGESIDGVTPIRATAATISVRINTNGAGKAVPAGFAVTGTTSAGIKVGFSLASEATSGADSTVTVTMTANVLGEIGNGVPIGTLTVVTATSTVVSAEALTESGGGVEAETLTAYLDRLIAYRSILRPGGVLADDLAILARSVAGVYRALGIDNVNAARTVTDGVTTNTSTTVTSATAAFISADVGRTITGAGIPAGATIATVVSATEITISAAATATATGVTLTLGEMTEQPRTAMVVPIDTKGAPVPAHVAGEVMALLESVRETNFVVTIGTPTYTAVNVAFTAVAETGADPATVQAAVNAAARGFIDPGRFAAGEDPDLPVWRPLTRISYLDLAHALRDVPGVASLTSLTINGATADLTLAGRAPLPASTDAANPSTVTGTVS